MSQTIWSCTFYCRGNNMKHQMCDTHTYFTVTQSVSTTANKLRQQTKQQNNFLVKYVIMQTQPSSVNAYFSDITYLCNLKVTVNTKFSQLFVTSSEPWTLLGGIHNEKQHVIMMSWIINENRYCNGSYALKQWRLASSLYQANVKQDHSKDF